MPEDWFACPHCGERLKRNARSCRHCGSDESTGWSEATYLDGADLPDEGDYAGSLEREGLRKRAAGAGPRLDTRRRITGAVATILILMFIAWLLRGSIN